MKYVVGDYTRMGGPGVALIERNGDELRLLSAVEGLKEPTWAQPASEGNVVYSLGNNAVEGENGGCAASYERTGDTLKLVSMRSTNGLAPCHMTESPDGKFLYVANYLGGSVAVFPIEGKALGKRVQLVQHEGHGPNEKRQECAHVHFTAFKPGTRQLYVVDLGIDAVMIYDQDPESGLLTLAERVDTPAGLGPRHLVFHGEDVIYLDYEMGGKVSLLRRVNGKWQIEQTLSTLPEDYDGFNGVAAIREWGGQIIVSNRGHNSLAFFNILPDQRLQRVGVFSVPGDFPRDFWMNEDGTILVANQESGDVRLLKRTESGLETLGAPLAIPGAVSVCPVDD